MNKANLLLFLLFFIICYSAFPQGDFPPKPSPTRLVNDLSNTLSPTEENALEQKLVAYNDSTSTQISIVLIRSVGPYDISDYTFQLGDLWGIGRKDKDNGMLILVAVEDREVFVATGYGLEGAVPDAVARRIVDNVIVPAFRREAYFEGLDQATDMVIKLAEGEYEAEEVATKGNNSGAIF